MIRVVLILDLPETPGGHYYMYLTRDKQTG
jgi:hypothetical protein